MQILLPEKIQKETKTKRVPTPVTNDELILHFNGTLQSKKKKPFTMNYDITYFGHLTLMLEDIPGIHHT